MSELRAPFGAPPDVPGVPDEPADRSADPSTVGTPVLITEQEVVFATAAAGVPQPAKAGRRWTEVIGALRAMVTSSTTEPRERRHYPARNDYLENSRMAREMHRL
jgi:hypothetical protein